MGGLAFDLALPTRRLFLHHGDTGPIHLHVDNADGFADYHGQVQTGGLCGSRPVRAERYRSQWLLLCVPPISWSPPGPPGFSSVLDRHQTVPPAQPWLACGVLRERIPYSRYPVRRRREIALGHSARTNSRDAKLPPTPRPSARACCAVRGSGLVGRKNKVACALLRRGPEIRAAGSRRRHPRGARPSAWPSRSPLDPAAPSCADPRTLS